MARALLHRPSMRPVLPAFLAAATAAVASACGGGALSATLEAPPVEVSSQQSMQELRVLARAQTSDAIADGEVRVRVRAADEADGQVRVTVGLGATLSADPTPTADVVECAVDSSVEIPRALLAGCDGACEQEIVVVFAAEGLESGKTVSLPVVVEAELLYEQSATVPDGDTLTLTLR
jgi:hypothetical protein